MAVERQALLKIGEVARRLGASDATVRVLVRSGELNPIQFGTHGHLRFEAEDVEAFIERSKRAAAA